MAGGFKNRESNTSGLTAAEILWVQTGNTGVLLLKEQASAPSATAGYGKLYTKQSDSSLYFLDDSGVEHALVGGATLNFADNETPSGTINGSNAAFTLAHSPSPAASLILEMNGQILTQGVEYTLSGATITFSTAPDAAFSGLPFKAWYRY